MKAISVFSGVGGFEIGFERAGIETVLQAEQDPWCLKVLEHHWPQTERVTDVRDVGDGEADLLYGGFPCQDLSVAGKRAGLGGERSGLFFEFARIADELRPRWLCLENVPGLLSSNQGRDFAVILDTLDELGYGVAWTVLDAQNFGVPQRRRRVFIVGCLGDGARAATVLSVCESGCGDPPKGGKAKQDVAGSLGGGSGSRGWSPDTDRATFVPVDGTVGTIDTECGGGKQVPIQGTLVGELPAATYWDGGQLSDTLDVAMLQKRQTMPEKRRFAGVLQNGVRRLTPRECERLMGWPEDHTRWTADGTEIADSHRYRMCGNGVVATCAEWIGHRMVKANG